jgi:hypothetical protein
VTGPDVFFEPLVGWRAWKAERHLLYSVNWDTPWPGMKRMEGGCAFGSQAAGGFVMHEVPSSSCHCGIYAFKTRAQADELALRVLDLSWDILTAEEAVALGRISMWGRVVETERGYRAQYAYPYDVILLGGSEQQAQAIREFYAVDVSCEPIPPNWLAARAPRAA